MGKMRHFDRWDHQVIYDAIPNGSSILDLGCGVGELLSSLIRDKGVHGLGIEIDLEKIKVAVANGVPALHLDLDEGLNGFPERFFDYVILQKTLQAVGKPVLALQEMLRVGRFGVVSFPNFGHKDVVEEFIKNRRMPITRRLPYTWYDTPNIHLCTINDFLDWAESNCVRINKAVVWADGEIREYADELYSWAEEALFIVTREA